MGRWGRTRALDRTLAKAWNSRSFDAIVDLLPFLLVAGELALDVEARTGLELIVKSIESEDDLWTWIEENQGVRVVETDALPAVIFGSTY